MTIHLLKNKFIDTLTPLYGAQEAATFFYWLTEAYLNMRRVDVAMSYEKQVEQTILDKFEVALVELQQQKPIQYIVGDTVFYGNEFKVTPSVLIPRPETEELVDWIISDAKNETSIKILDIGTGSGCIAISLAKALPKAKVSAIDVSEEALKIAKANAQHNGVEIEWIQQDILTTENLKTYDIIVSNPPYVRMLEKEEIKSNVLDYEPHLALFVPDTKALLFYEKITELALNSLSSKGKLFFEINQYLGKETVEMIKEKGFLNVELRKDFSQNDRMIKAFKK